MKKASLALLAAVTFVGGCSLWSPDEVTGKLLSKEYEGRNCEKRDRKGMCVKWDPAEFELTIKEEATGKEVELIVSRVVYDRAVEGTTATWKGERD
jgi:hypothetical protein